MTARRVFARPHAARDETRNAVDRLQSVQEIEVLLGDPLGFGILRRGVFEALRAEVNRRPQAVVVAVRHVPRIEVIDVSQIATSHRAVADMPRLHDRVVMLCLLAERHFPSEEMRQAICREDIRAAIRCRQDVDDFIADHPTRPHAIIPFAIGPAPRRADFRADP